MNTGPRYGKFDVALKVVVFEAVVLEEVVLKVVVLEVVALEVVALEVVALEVVALNVVAFNRVALKGVAVMLTVRLTEPDCFASASPVGSRKRGVLVVAVSLPVLVGITALTDLVTSKLASHDAMATVL
jgi:hypothetical protein